VLKLKIGLLECAMIAVGVSFIIGILVVFRLQLKAG
jgi:hypothetical protein